MGANQSGVVVTTADGAKSPRNSDDTERSPLHGNNDLESAVVVKPRTPTIPLNEKAWLRTWILALLFVALLEEAAYLFYQEENSNNGERDVGVAKKISPWFAWFLSLGDFIANVTATNPNEVDSVAFFTQPVLANMKYVIPVVRILSYASFFAGALASSVPVLKWLAKEKTLPNLAKQIFIPVVELGFAPTGTIYYIIFNVPSSSKTYKAVSDFLAQPSLVWQRIKKRPSNILRYLEVYGFRALAVASLRATNLAYVPEDLFPSLFRPYGVPAHTIGNLSSGSAGVTFFDTFVQVIFTRIYRSWEKLANTLFDYVTDEEYEAARKEYSVSVQTMLAHIASLLSAIGYGLMVHSLMSNHEWEVRWDSLLVGALLASICFAKSVFVEHTGDIYQGAIKKLNEQDRNILIRRQNLFRPELTEREEMIQRADQHFKALAETFDNKCRDNFFTACNIDARTARSLAFYGFIVFFSGQLKLIGIHLTNQQIYALCLMLIPENFKNDFLMFEGNIKETIRGYLAKLEIETFLKGRPLTWQEVVVAYFKSPYSYDIDQDIIPTYEKRQRALGRNLTAEREPLLQVRVDGGSRTPTPTPPATGGSLVGVFSRMNSSGNSSGNNLDELAGLPRGRGKRDHI